MENIPAENGWLPISMVPKGVPVLLLRFRRHRSMEGTFPVAVGVGIVTDDPGSLLDEYGEKLCHNAECQGQVEPKGCSYMGSACFMRPTHFMPLGLPEPEEGR